MAVQCSSSSVIFASHSPAKSFSSSHNKTLFLGFSLSSKPSIVVAKTHRATQILCQEKTALIPLEQRWMFEESEINGPDIWNETWYPKGADHVNTDKPWYIVDATDKILGRLASTIAIHIRGKNLATYTPSVDMGAFVIVVNAEKVAVSGKKRTQKLYRRHSGRPGGMKVETFDQLQQRIPERILEHAVRGMLPKGRDLNVRPQDSQHTSLITRPHPLTRGKQFLEGHSNFSLAFVRLGRQLFNHLKVYEGPDHPHDAQKPIELPIRDKRIQKQR